MLLRLADRRPSAPVHVILAAAALAATPACAEPGWLSAEAFRTFTEGRVVRTDLADGSPFGVEDFRPDGKVVWQEVDGTCLTGEWRAEGGSICYHYEGQPEPSCLRYLASGDELVGLQWDNARGDLGFLDFVVRLTPIDSAPLSCDVAPLS
jgi:hypothetical protein